MACYPFQHNAPHFKSINTHTGKHTHTPFLSLCFLKDRQMLLWRRAFAPVNRAEKASKEEERSGQEVGEAAVAAAAGRRGQR